MPRIYDKWLDSIIYLYPSVEAARRGDRAGGCGFLIDVPSEQSEQIKHTYAVTNSHVITEADSPVIRLNTIKGNSDEIKLGPTDWTHHPDDDDIAVALVNLQDGIYKTHAVSITSGLTPYMIDVFGYGPGDETFTISRFITQDGKQTNQPVVRFGNLAMMPAPVEHERGHSVESFLVESRSIAGMSGSPVFIYIPVIEAMSVDVGRAREIGNAKGPYLLGIDWGHLPVTEHVVDEHGNKHPEGWRVKSNSGFMAVAPAWKIAELIQGEDLVKERRMLDKTKMSERESAAISDAAEPFTKDDMERALKKVSRRRPKSSEPDSASSGT